MSFFGKTDVQGTVYLAFALFLAVALMSYHPLDPSLNTLGEEPVRNYCGYIGAFLSDLMYQIFGLASWLLVIAGFKRSFSSFAGRKKNQLTNLFNRSCFTVFCMCFCFFALAQFKIFSGSYHDRGNYRANDHFRINSSYT